MSSATPCLAYDAVFIHLDFLSCQDSNDTPPTLKTLGPNFKDICLNGNIFKALFILNCNVVSLAFIWAQGEKSSLTSKRKNSPNVKFTN